jgi:hypothetical protein
MPICRGLYCGLYCCCLYRKVGTRGHGRKRSFVRLWHGPREDSPVSLVSQAGQFMDKPAKRTTVCYARFRDTADQGPRNGFSLPSHKTDERLAAHSTSRQRRHPDPSNIFCALNILSSTARARVLIVEMIRPHVGRASRRRGSRHSSLNFSITSQGH